MQTERLEEWTRHIQTLCHLGSVGDLSDGELLDRFLDGDGMAADRAFEALVERHGSMILRLCRSILRDEHDAQDAFQATLLVLVRRASSVRKRESIGSWLHGVALKVACHSRLVNSQRRRHEHHYTERSSSIPAQSDPDLAGVIQEELGRLPDRFREVVVLCYLEGRTCEDAARQLKLPVGTIKSRLSRARGRLLNRLIRRGFGPSVALPPSGSLANRSAADLCKVVAHWRQLAGGPASARVVALVKGASKMMFMKKVAAIATALLLAAPLGLGLARMVRPIPGQEPSRRGEQAPTKSNRDTSKGDRTEPAIVTGSVVAPDGSAAIGAEVFLLDGYFPLKPDGSIFNPLGWDARHVGREGIVRGQGRADPDGKFRFKVTGKPLDEADRVVLWTHRPGAMASSVEVTRQSVALGTPLTIRLEAAKPTRFTVRGPDGRPVAGVRIVPTVLSRAHLSVPVPLRDRAAAMTDDQGHAGIEAFRPDEMSCIRTFSARFGMQQWGIHQFVDGDEPKVVNLLPVGSLKGQVLESETKVAARTRLLIATIPKTVPGPYVGVVELTTDDQGRFEVPVLPAGKLIIHVSPSDDRRDELDLSIENLQIEDGKEAKVLLRRDQAKPMNRPGR